MYSVYICAFKLIFKCIFKYFYGNIWHKFSDNIYAFLASSVRQYFMMLSLNFLVLTLFLASDFPVSQAMMHMQSFWKASIKLSSRGEVAVNLQIFVLHISKCIKCGAVDYTQISTLWSDLFLIKTSFQKSCGLPRCRSANLNCADILFLEEEPFSWNPFYPSCTFYKFTIMNFNTFRPIEAKI